MININDADKVFVRKFVKTALLALSIFVLLILVNETIKMFADTLSSEIKYGNNEFIVGKVYQINGEECKVSQVEKFSSFISIYCDTDNIK
jgi:hypothetical protein